MNYSAFICAWRELAASTLAINREKGFVPDDAAGIYWDGNQIALMHGELSEAHEALRKNLPDSHLTHRKGVEVELADCVIRIMNYAAERGLDIPGALVEKTEFNRNRPHMHGGKKF